MPSALETLVKILKLEREQGFKNTAVIGGLGAYSGKWKNDAHAQARRPEHHVLVDELYDILSGYDALETREDRSQKINYMLDRITGRVAPPPEYQQRIVQAQAAAPPQQTAPPPAQEREEAPLHKRERGKRGKHNNGHEENHQPEAEPERKRMPVRADAENSISPDDDFSRIEVDTRTPMKSDTPAPPRLARPPRKPRQPIDPQEAADIMRGLNAPVEKVKGVGPKMAQLLNRMGIFSINDLLFFLPRRYDDYTQLSQISRLQPNTVATVIGTVRYTEMRIARGGRKDFYMTIDDGTAQMGVTFFGQYFLNRQVRTEQQVVLHGQTTMYQSRIQMTNPEIQYIELEDLQKVGIVPVYPLTDGLNRRSLRKLMQKTVEYWADRLPDYMPEGTLDRAELADLAWTIKNLHFPESWDHLEHAQRRFIFDELLLMQLTILNNRRTWQAQPSQQLQVGDAELQAFIDSVFPFPLTGAQRRAIEDIRADLTQSIPMNRLLQGDVGSGKTAVAAAMLAIALMNGKQAALMAPTSILAEQHYRGLSAAFEQMPPELMPREGKPVIALLTGSVTNSEREAIYRGLADGSIDIVIGTHAIIQEGVEFENLAVAIIDEQHRFGVEQRGALRGKGTNPHLLVMTATPIPRTLALTLYADLDLSIIDEMPPGRIPIRTRVIEPPQRERAYHFVETQLEEGRQAFIVYPLVEASETIDAEFGGRSLRASQARFLPPQGRLAARAHEAGREGRSHERLPQPPVRRAGHDFGRGSRRGHPQCQHHRDRRREPLRLGAASPVSRASRARRLCFLLPAGLRFAAPRSPRPPDGVGANQ